MHCPQCGQQQASEEMRFCSRCGFPLGGVAQLMANGGTLSTIAGDSSCTKLSSRRKGVRRGAILIMLGAVLVPLLALLIDPPPGSLPEDRMPYLLIPLSAIIFFAGGLMRILYALLFEDSTPPALQASKFAPPTSPSSIAGQLNIPARGSALPPLTSVPVPEWKSQANTAEIISPSSVTENTTRLLYDEQD